MFLPYRQTRMGNLVTSAVGRHLRQPGRGPVGYFVKRTLMKRNKVLEVNAVRLANIEADYHVLEVGFGPGLGLVESYECVKDGTGVVYGLDFSEEMVKTASETLAEEIKDGKVKITLGDVAAMPYEADSFDAVFHCNCYYFWPDFKRTSAEILRVMKPGSMMVTTLNLARLKATYEMGFMSSAVDIDPNLYIKALQEVGFENVHITDQEEKGFKYEAIFAHVGMKDS